VNPPSGLEFCRFLERNGWVLLRQRGSHRVYGKAGEALRLAVPVHGSKPLKLGVFKGLLKDAKLDWP
jgi:predicted RNA binding protein YcfA (HicA-like mRNA interferase family)